MITDLTCFSEGQNPSSFFFHCVSQNWRRTEASEDGARADRVEGSKEKAGSRDARAERASIREGRRARDQGQSYTRREHGLQAWEFKLEAGEIHLGANRSMCFHFFASSFV